MTSARRTITNVAAPPPVAGDIWFMEYSADAGVATIEYRDVIEFAGKIVALVNVTEDFFRKSGLRVFDTDLNLEQSINWQTSASGILYTQMMVASNGDLYIAGIQRRPSSAGAMNVVTRMNSSFATVSTLSWWSGSGHIDILTPTYVEVGILDDGTDLYFSTTNGGSNISVSKIPYDLSVVSVMTTHAIGNAEGTCSILDYGTDIFVVTPERFIARISKSTLLRTTTAYNPTVSRTYHAVLSADNQSIICFSLGGANFYPSVVHVNIDSQNVTASTIAQANSGWRGSIYHGGLRHSDGSLYHIGGQRLSSIYDAPGYTKFNSTGTAVDHNRKLYDSDVTLSLNTRSHAAIELASGSIVMVGSIQAAQESDKISAFITIFDPTAITVPAQPACDTSVRLEDESYTEASVTTSATFSPTESAETPAYLTDAIATYTLNSTTVGPCAWGAI